LAAAKPILVGEMSCTEVPHMTLPPMMLAMAALGKKEHARHRAAESYKLVRWNPLFLEQVALHVELHVSEGDLAQASEIAVRHLPWLQIATNDKQQFHYFRALHCLLLESAKATRAQSVKWQAQLLDALEATFGCSPQAAGIAERHALLTGLVAEKGSALVQAFDRRNGNDYYLKTWQAEAFAVAG